MSTNKPLVCICCKKSYQMPTCLVPAEVAPWSAYGICDACDTVVVKGRLLDRVNELSQFIGAQFNEQEADEITEISETKAMPEPKKRKYAPRAKKIAQETKPVIETPRPAVVIPAILTPAAQAQLSLF